VRNENRFLAIGFDGFAGLVIGFGLSGGFDGGRLWLGGPAGLTYRDSRRCYRFVRLRDRFGEFLGPRFDFGRNWFALRGFRSPSKETPSAPCRSHVVGPGGVRGQIT
jgi:hypothetical protein